MTPEPIGKPWAPNFGYCLRVARPGCSSRMVARVVLAPLMVATIVSIIKTTTRLLKGNLTQIGAEIKDVAPAEGAPSFRRRAMCSCR